MKRFSVVVERRTQDIEQKTVIVAAQSKGQAKRLAVQQATTNADGLFWHDAKCFPDESFDPGIASVTELP